MAGERPSPHGPTDGTERTRVEDAARQVEKILADVEAVAGFGHYILDLRAGTWTSSEALDRLFGIGPDFVRDVEGWLFLVHPNHQDGMRRYFAEDVVGREQRFEKDYRIARSSDGAERWVFGTGQLELDEEANVVRMLGAIQDITERKREELEREALLEIMQGLVSFLVPGSDVLVHARARRHRSRISRTFLRSSTG